MFAKLGPKLNSGKPLTKEEIDEFGMGVDTDDDDSDYDYNAGDDAIYESKLDDFDELVILRDTLKELNQNNAPLFERLYSGITDNA